MRCREDKKITGLLYIIILLYVLHVRHRNYMYLYTFMFVNMHIILRYVHAACNQHTHGGPLKLTIASSVVTNISCWMQDFKYIYTGIACKQDILLQLYTAATLFPSNNMDNKRFLWRTVLSSCSRSHLTWGMYIL